MTAIRVVSKVGVFAISESIIYIANSLEAC
jgi:hypothetical protein